RLYVWRMVAINLNKIMNGDLVSQLLFGQPEIECISSNTLSKKLLKLLIHVLGRQGNVLCNVRGNCSKAAENEAALRVKCIIQIKNDGLPCLHTVPETRKRNHRNGIDRDQSDTAGRAQESPGGHLPPAPATSGENPLRRRSLMECHHQAVR